MRGKRRPTAVGEVERDRVTAGLFQQVGDDYTGQWAAIFMFNSFDPDYDWYRDGHLQDFNSDPQVWVYYRD